MGDALTWDQLNRATLERQGLLRRWDLGPEAALQRLGILQAQEPAGVWLALAARLGAFDPTTLDQAFLEGRIVRGTLVRITLSASSSEDYPSFHRAMDASLRGARVNDRRFTETGLTAAALEDALPALLAFAQEPKSVDELRVFLSDRLGTDHSRVWWALKTFAPLVQVPDQDPWLFGPGRRFRAGPAAGEPLTAEAGVEALLLRYLGAFGPASAQDFCRFTLLRSPVVNQALRALGDRVVSFKGPAGTLWDLPGYAVPSGLEPSPVRLLPLWDQTLMAYTDVQRMFAPGARERLAQVNGDLLPPVFVGGRASGVWRPVDGGVEVSAFRTLSGREWEEAEAEARALVPLLARDPGLYRRFSHWWTKGLEAAEVRVL